MLAQPMDDASKLELLPLRDVQAPKSITQALRVLRLLLCLMLKHLLIGRIVLQYGHASLW